jgi:hypothetical protein
MKRLALLLLAGCATMRGRADDAYAHGNYLEAADLYDKLVAANPRDAQVVAMRDRARAGELRDELMHVQAARIARLDAEATGLLALLLEQRDVWGGKTPDDIAPQLTMEVTLAGERVSGEIAASIAKAGPLAGEDAEAHHAHLLAHRDFDDTRTKLHATLTAAGRARCDQLVAIAATPYWSWLADRYCAHFGELHAVPVLPAQHTALVVEGAVAGESDDETSALRGALRAAFARSPFYAATGTGELHATVDGTLDVQASSRETTLTAEWTEQVSYTDYETQQESYQEPYDDTESYTEDVTDSDGNTHTEFKTRTVTKYRTAYRDVTVPVTKTRDEARSEDYPAVERSATYAAALHVHTDAPAIEARTTARTSEHGYDVDTTIAAANVAPHTAALHTQDQFATEQHARLAGELAAQLKAEYMREFCSAPTYTIEEAARCAYGGLDRLPKPARESLGQVFGAETPYLGQVLAN